MENKAFDVSKVSRVFTPTENVEYNKETRKDAHTIDPRLCRFIDGFNSRTEYDISDILPSIMERGVMQPVTVEPMKDENGETYYRVIDGHRRILCANEVIKQNPHMRIPAIFKRFNNDAERLVAQLVSNEGKPFTDYELGLLFQKFRDGFNYTISEIAKAVNKEEALVRRCLSLLNAPDEIKEYLAKGIISATTYLYLAKIEKDEKKLSKLIRNKVEEMQTEANFSRSEDVSDDDMTATTDKAKKTSKKAKKAKVTFKDFKDTHLKEKVDSQTILKGITLLYEYIGKYKDENGMIPFQVNFLLIKEKLEENKTITEIFDDLMQEAYKNVM